MVTRHSSKWGDNVNALPNREGAPREALSDSFIISNMRFVTFMVMCEILGVVYEQPSKIIYHR